MIVRPDESVLTVAWVVGFWWVLAGVMQLVAGIVEAEGRGFNIALGLLGIVAGGIILAQPEHRPHHARVDRGPRAAAAGRRSRSPPAWRSASCTRQGRCEAGRAGRGAARRPLVRGGLRQSPEDEARNEGEQVGEDVRRPVRRDLGRGGAAGARRPARRRAGHLGGRHADARERPGRDPARRRWPRRSRSPARRTRPPEAPPSRSARRPTRSAAATTRSRTSSGAGSKRATTASSRGVPAPPSRRITRAG